MISQSAKRKGGGMDGKRKKTFDRPPLFFPDIYTSRLNCCTSIKYHVKNGRPSDRIPPPQTTTTLAFSSSLQKMEALTATPWEERG